MTCDNCGCEACEATRAERFCNLCGLSCTVGKGSGGEDRHGGLVKARVSGGYESTPGNGDGALDDCTSYGFDLCEWCCDWLFGQFKLPVRLGRYMGGDADGEPPFRPAAQRVAEEDWRSQKDRFAAEYERRSAARGKRND